jgi:KaiC/GvpD/RAD55 family RecA-like ATPase
VPEKSKKKGSIYLTSLSSLRRGGNFEDYLALLVEQSKNYFSNYGSEKISMIIIDSLNVFGRDAIGRLQLETLKTTLAAKNRILIFLGEPEETLTWDRLVDMVIELGSKPALGDYFLRAITISKARFQNHILGSHVAKIKGKGFGSLPEEKFDADSTSRDAEIGFFIYPSLHYHLSVAIERKRLGESRQETRGKKHTVLLETGFTALDRALDGGVKRGTMTAISSNLSYVARGVGLSFLAKGVERGEQSLYLSLQDDPDSIRKLPVDEKISTFTRSKSLVIKSFRPGFISAEEFVDKIINEILDKNRNVQFQRVLFDDVSQIGLRFPLLASAPVFLPTLMDIFKLYDMTALFLSTTISSGDVLNPPRNDLYDLVNTLIEVQGPSQSSGTEAVVRIRKIAEQFYVPQELRLTIEHKAGGRISILKQS